MLNDMFSSSSIPALEQWINFAESRHNILATNVANIDVPGYRTRDLSVDQFQSQLKDAIHARDTDHSESLMNERLISVNPFDKVKQGMNNILYHDESNVGLEQQVAEITKNQMQHNLALTVLTAQFRMLMTAVSERA